MILEARERSSLFFKMAPTALVKKTGSKPKPKPAEKKRPQLPSNPVEVPSSDDEEGWEDESESDEEEDGVDEVGLENLIKALGDDGLNEYDQVHLVSLAGDEEADEGSEEGEDAEEDDELGGVPVSEQDGKEVPEGDEEAEEGCSGPGSEAEEGESSGDEDGLALDELEDVELHPDAVPRRSLKVTDNKVRAP